MTKIEAIEFLKIKLASIENAEYDCFSGSKHSFYKTCNVCGRTTIDGHDEDCVYHEVTGDIPKIIAIIALLNQ